MARSDVSERVCMSWQVCVCAVSDGKCDGITVCVCAVSDGKCDGITVCVCTVSDGKCDGITVCDVQSLMASVMASQCVYVHHLPSETYRKQRQL